MGTFLELQFLGACQETKAQSVILSAKNYLDKLESELSLYQKNSQLSVLNSLGSISDVSDDFLNLLILSFDHNKKTQGVFNIAIYPVLNEIKKSFERLEIPPRYLKVLKPKIDLTQIEVNNRRVSFKQKGMMLTFDGIAKGYAVDKISEFLLSADIQNYLVNFSGNMKWNGHREDGKLWSIAIWDPIAKKSISIRNTGSGAIASSGVDYSYYSKNKKWHHIINPKTLMPANTNIAATAVGPSATICDILSTSTFIFSDFERETIYSKDYPDYQYWVRTTAGKIKSNLR